MRSKSALKTALVIVGLVGTSSGLWGQGASNNAKPAPETPLPRVRPGIWRAVGDTPCLNMWDAIYQCPPPPSTVAIRAGKLFDSLTGRMLTKQVIVVRGQRIIDVGADGSVAIPAALQPHLKAEKISA